MEKLTRVFVKVDSWSVHNILANANSINFSSPATKFGSSLIVCLIHTLLLKYLVYDSY